MNFVKLAEKCRNQVDVVDKEGCRTFEKMNGWMNGCLYGWIGKGILAAEIREQQMSELNR